MYFVAVIIVQKAFWKTVYQCEVHVLRLYNTVDNIVSLQRDLKVLYPTPTHAYLVLREALSADLFLWRLLVISVFGFT